MDKYANAVREAWSTHAAALKSGIEADIMSAYRAVLVAERALEIDSARGAVTAGQRANYAATIAAYDARIEELDRSVAA